MIAKITRRLREAGQGREADANRAATQLARREAYIQAAEGEVLTASAMLCRILNLDPVDSPSSDRRIRGASSAGPRSDTGGRTDRPGPPPPTGIGCPHAAIQAALMNLDGAKILPFSPTTLVGFSAGGFAGGSNLVRPIFGGMSGREDLDAIMYWTIQNLGAGNIALIRLADAQLKVTHSGRSKFSIKCERRRRSLCRTHARYNQMALMKTPSDRVILRTMKTLTGLFDGGRSPATCCRSSS